MITQVECDKLKPLAIMFNVLYVTIATQFSIKGLFGYNNPDASLGTVYSY